MDNPNHDSSALDPRPLDRVNLHRFDQTPPPAAVADRAAVADHPGFLPGAALASNGSRVIVLTRRTYILGILGILGILALGVLGTYSYGLWLAHQEQHRRADWVYQIISATVAEQQQRQRQQQQAQPQPPPPSLP